ncbi:MAG: hypothetical protein WCC64_23420 [Aliidongia sp.]
MNSVFRGKTRWFFCAVIMACCVVYPAQSRTWLRNAIGLAQDYALINDNRGKGDVVLLLWLAPPMFEKGPNTQTASELFDKYVVLGVVHQHTANDGTTSFGSVTTLTATDGAGNIMKSLDGTAIPPTVVGVMATVQAVFARSLGALGQGVHWFVFNGDTVHACTKGRLSVPFEGEVYTYDTPIPGCNATAQPAANRT